MEFLVEFEVHIPSEIPASEVESRITAEAKAAAELADRGILVRLWRLAAQAGKTKAIGVYRADSEARLGDLLRDLPLYDWLQITVTALEPHPNDPAANAVISEPAGVAP